MRRDWDAKDDTLLPLMPRCVRCTAIFVLSAKQQEQARRGIQPVCPFCTNEIA